MAQDAYDNAPSSDNEAALIDENGAWAQHEKAGNLVAILRG